MIMIESFTDLETWKAAHAFRVKVINQTLKFGKEHQYGLTSQLQRAAISIGSNIAEGFGRQGKQEKLQFYRISRGSLTEIQDQLILARDIRLIENAAFKVLAEESIIVHKLLNGLIRSTSKLAPSSQILDSAKGRSR